LARNSLEDRHQTVDYGLFMDGGNTFAAKIVLKFPIVAVNVHSPTAPVPSH
jgi:hypothetical protein